MNFEFFPPAEDEYLAAANYYDQQQKQLGDRFVRDIEETIARICRDPFAWRKLSRHARRCLARHFPYGVIYVVGDGDIIILAVMHLARRPGYWKKRMHDLRRRRDDLKFS